MIMFRRDVNAHDDAHDHDHDHGGHDRHSTVDNSCTELKINQHRLQS